MVATVSLSDRLEMEIYSIGKDVSKSLTVKLSRIEAQRLADALLEFSGAASKSAGRRSRVVVGAVDLDKGESAAPVSLRVSTRRGAVKL